MKTEIIKKKRAQGVCDGINRDDLLVTVTLSLDLSEYVDAVVVAQSTAHLVVVHRQMILLDAPEPRQARGVDDFEDTRFPALPRYVVCVPLRRVVEQLLQEVPEQSAVCNDKIRASVIAMMLESILII